MPSIIPKAMVDSPRYPVMYSGRTADTDSEEISVIMLTMPSQMITGESRKAVWTAAGPAIAWSFWPPLRSAIEMYTGCLFLLDGGKARHRCRFRPDFLVPSVLHPPAFHGTEKSADSMWKATSGRCVAAAGTPGRCGKNGS